MPRRSLLITFDAFGTLFSPRFGIAKQYRDVAREHDVHVGEKEVEDSFDTAFKSMCKEYPNYGRNVGMNPEDWWGGVVHRTFSPFCSHSTPPPSLGPALISHFASSRAYKLHPSVPPLFDTLRSSSSPYNRTLIGVISNSDPRVSSILTSLGVSVHDYVSQAPGGFITHKQNALSLDRAKEGARGIDFLTLSYDVGVEKPDRRVFEAAWGKAVNLLEKEGKSSERGEWDMVHVGDDVVKDVEAAERAGWKGVLWDEVHGAWKGLGEIVDIEAKKVEEVEGSSEGEAKGGQRRE